MYSLRQQRNVIFRVQPAIPTLITTVQQVPTSNTKIEVRPISQATEHANCSRERLRQKIAESQRQHRLRVNWSALSDM